MASPDETPTLDLDPAALKLRRASTAEQAADTVRALILRRELEPGTPLRETHLAQALGISRNTMREALRLLAREGLIAQDRHHVATVATLTVEDVRDIYALRGLLELGAVDALAALTEPPDVRAVQAAASELARIAGADDWQRVIDADRGFHDGLVALAGSPRLAAAYAQLEGEIRLCMSITTRAHRDQAELAEQHAGMVELLQERRYDRLKDVLGFHMDAARDRVVRVLRGDEEPPSTPSQRGGEDA